MLSLGQAAKLAGCGKTTISRAIEAGRLSAGRKSDGGYEIDPAELARVYDLKFDAVTGEPVPRDGRAERDETPAEQGRAAELESLMAVLEERISGLKATAEAERRRADAAEADRDRWAAQAERISALLPPPASAAPIAAEPESKILTPTGFMALLFGSKSA